ncbi:MAG: ATP-binding cassette domain-containing protein [Candidatus Bipolaricaulaceae bacterium]
MIPGTAAKTARVLEVLVDPLRYRWYGALVVEAEAGSFRLPMTGTVAQWFRPGEEVLLELAPEADPQNLSFAGYKLWRLLEDGPLLVWPLYRASFVRERTSPLDGSLLYTYRVEAREAALESDYEAIVELEQHHYAAEEELLARWFCPEDRAIKEANARPLCPRCGKPMRFSDLVDATRASRFLVLTREEREPYEPRYIGYVRLDPPLPLLHRRLPSGKVQPHIRREIFPSEWYEPPFWPERLVEELRQKGPNLSPLELWWRAQGEALLVCDTRAARLARVVIHPDYRAEGLGRLALEAAVAWIRERRVPEMRQPKEVFETVAQMARYNPFLERAGFRYIGDTASGRPFLVLPLTPEAERHLRRFFRTDPLAREHRGKLYRPAFPQVEPLAGPIRIQRLSFRYENLLDLSRMAEPVQEALLAFGVRRRAIQRLIFRNLSLTIKPGEIVALVGASGAGKSTLLRLLWAAAAGEERILGRLQSGTIGIPENARVAAYLPGELEPKFGRVPILQALYELTGDVTMAIEILNVTGIADVVLYRARFSELSTGQKERARLAYLLAQRPNLLLLDEFAAHLDPAGASRVARKVAELCREKGITLILATHRPEALRALQPDRTLVVGHGGLAVIS